MTAPVAWMARSLLATLVAVTLLSIAGILAGIAFGLTIAGAIGLYFVVWWTALFAVLPISMRTQAEEGEIAPGTDPGAPAAPALRERAIWTTIVSSILFAAIGALFPLAGL